MNSRFFSSFHSLLRFYESWKKREHESLSPWFAFDAMLSFNEQSAHRHTWICNNLLLVLYFYKIGFVAAFLSCVFSVKSESNECSWNILLLILFVPLDIIDCSGMYELEFRTKMMWMSLYKLIDRFIFHVSKFEYSFCQ